MSHHLLHLDYRFERKGNSETFAWLHFTFSQALEDDSESAPANARLPEAFGVLETSVDHLFLEGTHAAPTGPNLFAIKGGQKTPMYNEHFSEIEAGFDYQGQYREIGTRGGGGWFTKSLGGPSEGARASLRGSLKRWSPEEIIVRLTISLSAGHWANLAFLDHILNLPDLSLSPEATAAVARIAALRQGSVPSGLAEWRKRLGGVDPG